MSAAYRTYLGGYIRSSHWGHHGTFGSLFQDVCLWFTACLACAVQESVLGWWSTRVGPEMEWRVHGVNETNPCSHWPLPQCIMEIECQWWRPWAFDECLHEPAKYETFKDCLVQSNVIAPSYVSALTNNVSHWRSFINLPWDAFYCFFNDHYVVTRDAVIFHLTTLDSLSSFTKSYDIQLTQFSTSPYLSMCYLNLSSVSQPRIRNCKHRVQNPQCSTHSVKL